MNRDYTSCSVDEDLQGVLERASAAGTTTVLVLNSENELQGVIHTDAALELALVERIREENSARESDEDIFI